MKKTILILFIIFFTLSYSAREISFFKQKEKVAKERMIKLNKKENTEIEEVQEKVDSKRNKKEEIKVLQNKKYKLNKKLIDYIRGQNPKLSEKMTIHILENVFKYSKEYNINPILVLAIMNTESHFNHSTISSAGAKGLMQLMPFNFKEFGVNNSIEGNIKGGILHLKRDYSKTNDIIKTLVCYNAGCGRLKDNKWKSIKETREYIPKVFKKYYVIKNL